MNSYFSTLSQLKAKFLLPQTGSIATSAIAILLFVSTPASAHHFIGGKTPDNAMDAFLSGLGHPIIGLDHFAFVVAAGLLAAALGQRWLIPITFVMTSMMGTGIHLMGVELPIPEWVIAASVLVFGVLLTLKTLPPSNVVIGLAAIAGIFHGYAYGESIFGAEMGPLVAYLLGFAVIQLAIATAAYGAGSTILSKLGDPSGSAVRFAGFIVCGVGATFLLTLMVDSILPA